jgi:hypothetical protein
MAEEVYETDAREAKAWRRVLAAARKIGKQIDNADLAEAVANSHHQDVATRDMRRSESLAALLEAAVDSDSAGSAKPAKGTTKSAPAASE